MIKGLAIDVWEDLSGPQFTALWCHRVSGKQTPLQASSAVDSSMYCVRTCQPIVVVEEANGRPLTFERGGSILGFALNFGPSTAVNLP